ncbi:MAG: hypothetical protein WCT39_01895 [Candidatus Margulisiibacteriota bacterium]
MNIALYPYNISMLTLLPKILTILYIAFVSLFALDVFSGGFSWLGTIIALLIHLIPAFILIACLALVWRKPLIGGTLFVGLGIIFTLFFRTYQRLDVFLLISFPLLVIGALFILSGMKIRNNT